MAFLLSPKTGGGAVSYALVTGNGAVSINGGAAQTYSPESPGIAAPGDVLTWDSSVGTVVCVYLPTMDFDNPAVKEVTETNYSHTVEAVPGATVLLIDS